MLNRALTQGLMNKYRRGIITPVIIKSRENQFDSLITELQEIRNSFNFPQIFDFKGIPSIFGFGLKKLRRFNMVSIPLIADLVEDLSESVKVEKMYPDLIKYAIQDGVFADRRGKKFTTTYYTKRVIGADRANQEGFTGKGVKVVVIDTGVRASHPQARGFIARTAAAGKGMSGYDSNGHGTHVSTTIAGSYQVDPAYKTPVEGIAPGTTLISIQALGYVVGMGATSDILKAMDMAIEIGADIVSMSLGSNESPPDAENPEAEVINKLIEHNIIPVVAAGNSGNAAGTVGSPGSCLNALTVGAWDTINNKLADFSSRGPTKGDGLTKPDVIAPGFRIDSGTVGLIDAQSPGQLKYASISGTSMATPHVSGILAAARQMYMQQGITLTADMVKDAMKLHSGKTKDNSSGWGLLTWDILKAHLQHAGGKAA